MTINKNRILEKFYTNKETAKLCVELWQKKIEIKKNDIIIEPSAGNGSFSNIIKNKYKNVKAYDIQPECSSIIKKDFLELDLTKFDRPVHFIGSPPFGRNSSLAKKFIKKCLTIAATISFILPKSFKKESNNRVFSLYFHNVLTYDLPVNCFTINGKNYNVPCIFQIWVKKKIKRNLDVVFKTSYYLFLKKNSMLTPSVIIKRVGYAGRINFAKEWLNKSKSTHFFLKLHTAIHIKKFVEIYQKNVKFIFNDNIGINTITKNQLATELEKFEVFKYSITNNYLVNIRNWLLFYFYLKDTIKNQKILKFFNINYRRFFIIMKKFRKKFKIREKVKFFSKKKNNHLQTITKVFVILEKKKEKLIFSNNFNSKNPIFSLLRFYKKSYKKRC